MWFCCKFSSNTLPNIICNTFAFVKWNRDQGQITLIAQHTPFAYLHLSTDNPADISHYWFVHLYVLESTMVYMKYWDMSVCIQSHIFMFMQNISLSCIVYLKVFCSIQPPNINLYLSYKPSSSHNTLVFGLAALLCKRITHMEAPGIT